MRSREVVAENYPQVRLVDTGFNGGPCLARNVGAQHASHERVLFVDNDVVLHPGAIAALQRCMDRGRCHRDGAGPLGLRRRHSAWCTTTAATCTSSARWCCATGTARSPRPTSPTSPIGAGIALCFLAKKSAYEQVGGFDQNLFILYEDNEFSYKLRMRGHQIRLCPDAICTHKAGTVGLSVRGQAEVPRQAHLSAQQEPLVRVVHLHALAHAAADRSGAAGLRHRLRGVRRSTRPPRLVAAGQVGAAQAACPKRSPRAVRRSAVAPFPIANCWLRRP